jgi:hypothetical protein
MIERVMNLPIFMFTRVALSVLISASAGIIVLGFLWMLWGFTDDVYNALVPEVEMIEEATASLAVIEPIIVTAEFRKPFVMSDEAFEKYQKTSVWEKHLESGRVSNLMVALDEGKNEVELYAD